MVEDTQTAIEQKLNCCQVEDYNLQKEEEGAVELVYTNSLQMCSPSHVHPKEHPTIKPLRKPISALNPEQCQTRLQGI